MKQLTLDNIKALEPCQSRLDNFIRHYPDFKGSIIKFLELEHVTYDDKIWVIARVLDDKTLRQWSLACAKSVLHIFENIYPNDKRPREALEYLESLDLGNITEYQKRKCKELGDNAADYYYASRTTSRAALFASCATYYAADAAIYAADYNAADYNAAAYSAANAAYYAATYAADTAYSAAADASADQKSQQDLNLLFLYDIISQNR